MKAIRSILKYIITFILAFLVMLIGLVYIFAKGPSESVRDLFVVTCMQTSAAKVLPTMFLSKYLVDRIVEENSISADIEAGDTDLIDTEGSTLDMSMVSVEDITGPTFKGKVMIVNDPSRVYVYSIPKYGVPRGKSVEAMVEEENALAGINGGGFEDIGGQGKGGTAVGLVITKGEYKLGSKTGKHQVIGMTNDNKLVVGTMTGQEAIDMGVRDAVEWGPALVINGEPTEVGDSGGGLNPRTAIGQRADGAIIMVVTDGRMPGSMGASYADVQGILLDYGCINAGNLDGGYSSSMVYEGEVISKVYSPFGERPLPTAILVKR